MLRNAERERLVDEYEANHNAQKIAERYGVSKWTVYRLASQKRRTGCIALKTNQRGRKRAISGAKLNQIRRYIAERPDISLPEIQKKLRMDVSCSTIHTTIKAVQLRDL